MSYGLTPVSVDTHQERITAIRAYPRWLRYGLEGNPMHLLWCWETQVAFAFLAVTPWKWFDQGDAMTEHEALARLGSNGDTEELA